MRRIEIRYKPSVNLLWGNVTEFKISHCNRYLIVKVLVWCFQQQQGEGKKDVKFLEVPLTALVALLSAVTTTLSSLQSPPTHPSPHLHHQYLLWPWSRYLDILSRWTSPDANGNNLGASVNMWSEIITYIPGIQTHDAVIHDKQLHQHTVNLWTLNE